MQYFSDCYHVFCHVACINNFMISDYYYMLTTIIPWIICIHYVGKINYQACNCVQHAYHFRGLVSTDFGLACRKANFLDSL